MILRSHFVLDLLQCGYNVLLSDTDIFFRKNPLDILLSKEYSKYDIIFQEDNTGISMLDKWQHISIPYACGGFIFMKSNPKTKSLWERVIRFQHSHELNRSDQKALNVCLWTQMGIKWQVLPRLQFPAGLAYFKHQFPLKEAVMVHANWIKRAEFKWDYMRNYELFCF